jgi:hypothetical protein
MPRDGQQPGLEARVAAEAVEAPERQQKGVLCRVLRVRVGTQGRERGAIDRRPMPFDQLAKGGRVPLPGPRDQVDIAHTDCRHRRGFGGWADARLKPSRSKEERSGGDEERGGGRINWSAKALAERFSL